MKDQKIITLLASATEIICALGYEKEIVARSHECDYPSSISSLPVCTELKIDASKTSLELNDQLRTIINNGLSIYKVDSDLLKQLEPDLIVTQTQCEACAVSPRDFDQAVQDWIGTKPRIVSLEPNSLKDIWTDIRKVAVALGDKDRGEQLVSELFAKMLAIREKAVNSASQPTLGCIEWIDPLMAAGNWIPELVEMAGGRNVFGEAGKHSTWMSWETLYDEDPEMILFIPCGYSINESRQNIPALTRNPEWTSLRAVKSNQVFIADGSQYFNRPGPRLVESLEILSEILHPELFNARFEGIGWEYL
jgi:iron complex transport system substrate-binding protein